MHDDTLITIEPVKLTPEPMSEPPASDIPVYTVAPSPTPSAAELTTRSLYEGDISDSILTRLSSYYINAVGANSPDYFIVRTAQYDYSLYYGDISPDGSIINSAVRVRYYATQTAGYNLAWRVAISDATGAVDVPAAGANYSAYVYSNHSDRWLPSPYITTNKDNAFTRVFLLAFLLLFCLSFLIMFIRRLFYAKKDD